jgi:hypothetical protein
VSERYITATGSSNIIKPPICSYVLVLEIFVTWGIIYGNPVPCHKNRY